MITVGGYSDNVRPFFRCKFSYNAGATVTILYPRLCIGTGSDASPTSSTAQGLVVGSVAMCLKTIIVCCSASAGTTAISLVGATDYTSYSAIASGSASLAAGVNTIDYLTLVGAHTIPAGNIVALGIDPTTTPGYVVGQLYFEAV